MIIFTTENIERLAPKRQSNNHNWHGQIVCLAEVNEDFSISQLTMQELEIDFWWECGDGYFDPLVFDYDYWQTNGLLKGIEQTYSVSKEKNVAMAIGVLARNIGENEIDFFNSSIL